MAVVEVLHDGDVKMAQLDKLALYSLVLPEKEELIHADGNLVYNLQIFKSGSFKDSQGELRTWTGEQLEKMVSNFRALKSSGTFPNVPVRLDHSQSVDKVVGYIADVSVSGDRLVANIEFTEPDAFAKYKRGTYRSRSIEVGAYEDNGGTTHWPVVLGLAFVDIPAVEGLHSKSLSNFSYQDVTPPKETSVPDKDEQKFTFRLRGNETFDFAKAQAHIEALEGEVDGLKSRNEALETFAKEQKVSHRHNYVSGLAEARKVAATQIEALKTLVESMTDEQFVAFQKAYEGAPVSSLLGDHSSGSTTNPDGEGSDNEELETAKELVAMHRYAGMTDEEIEKTSAYRKVVALTGQK